jgi:dihydrofolate synthase/folylpolyglutamate synthase
MYDLPRYGSGICLARMAALLDALGIDRARLRERSVAITGSNGKGSTAAFCAEIARAHDLRAGLFTSPHLFRLNERFKIDGAVIDDEALESQAARVMGLIEAISKRSGEQFGAFEAMFALACLHFQDSDCAFQVFEAGIGGRYDPVRLLDSRLACVTSVDYEHVELLGRSLELIVSDKSDACASGGTIIYGENCRELRPHILEYNRSRVVQSLFVRDEIEIGGEAASATGEKFDLAFGGHHFCALELALPGRFQINNAAIAVTLFMQWLKDVRPSQNDRRLRVSVRSGLRDTRWPGRLEAIADNPLTVIDVGHTPDAIRQSLAGLHRAYGTSGWILVIGVSFDKKADEIAQSLAPACDTVICTSAHHKGGDAAALAAVVGRANPQAEIRIATTMTQAVSESRALAASLNRRVYVAGGLFTAVEYAAIVRGLDVTELRFF